MTRYKDLLEQMTLSEKCSLLSGKDQWRSKSIERFEVRSLFFSDGPSGLRKQLGKGDHLGINPSLPATCWPTAAAVACSWDPNLGEQIGHLLGREAVAQKVDVVLGPGLNIKRSALCGRNFEYFSEDPYLSGKMAAGYIRGIQSQGVAACPKHFAANNQELHRMSSNSVVDERTLREIYLTNFEIAVKEGKPKTIMSSYNQVNGVYANENKHLLHDILVTEWGFDGVVISDWGGSNDHIEGVRAGSHLEMPATGGDSDLQLEQAVKEGLISEDIIDQRIDTLLGLIYGVKPETQEAEESFDAALHHAFAEKAAEQTIVLLKNELDFLPLKAGTKVAVFGDFASVPRYQGAGSSLVNPSKLENILGVINAFELRNLGFCPGFKRNGGIDEDLEDQAIALAKQADVLLVCLGLPEVSEIEGVDRSHMRLPQNQVDLLHALTAVNQNIVVLLSAGSPVEIPWIEDCKALVYCGLSGQAGASAALKVVMGHVNPSGKLAETFPMRYEDEPVSSYYPGQQRSAEYREGLFVGYRYFETTGKPVRYPFGFGLSFTEYDYSDLQVSKTEVTFTLKNLGKMAGNEIAQLYIGCSGSKIFRPAKELKGFAKVSLRPGESKTVSIPLDDKAFRYFNVSTGHWEMETSEYQIMVGASVMDIRLTATIHVDGTKTGNPEIYGSLPSYSSGHVEQVSDDEFISLLGYQPPNPNWDFEEPLGINDALCQMFYAKSGLARLVYKVFVHLKKKALSENKPNFNLFFLFEIPFRGIAKMTEGMVTMNMAKAIVIIVNGHFFKGVGQLLKAFFAGRKAQKYMDHRRGEKKDREVAVL